MLIQCPHDSLFLPFKLSCIFIIVSALFVNSLEVFFNGTVTTWVNSDQLIQHGVFVKLHHNEASTTWVILKLIIQTYNYLYYQKKAYNYLIIWYFPQIFIRYEHVTCMKGSTKGRVKELASTHLISCLLPNLTIMWVNEN